METTPLRAGERWLRPHCSNHCSVYPTGADGAADAQAGFHNNQQLRQPVALSGWLVGGRDGKQAATRQDATVRWVAVATEPSGAQWPLCASSAPIVGKWTQCDGPQECQALSGVESHDAAGSERSRQRITWQRSTAATWATPESHYTPLCTASG